MSIVLPTGFKPGARSAVEVPVELSGNTRVFLSKQQAEAFARDKAHLFRFHRDYAPLTTPSGVELDAPSLEGKMVLLRSAYAQQAALILKRMTAAEFRRTREINAGLEEKALPTEEIHSDFAYSERRRLRPSYVEVLVARRNPSLFHLFIVDKRMSAKNFLDYLTALGVLHSMGWRHGHPHLGNAFFEEATGKVGLFDFSAAQKPQVDFSSASSVFRAFEPDYCTAMNNLVRFATGDDRLFKELRNGEISRFTSALVKELPASRSVKEGVQRRLEQAVYSRIIPLLRQHGYFEHRGRKW